MSLDFRILELVCSRLCHDLISPVGAVGNGLELMAEDSGGGDLLIEARRLVESSAQRATALLQLYRCAYGSAGNQSSFGAAEAVKLARDVIDSGRVEFDAKLSPAAEWPAGFGKLLVNGILVALEWLPRGGALSLSVTSVNGAAGFELSATAPQVTVGSQVGHLLQCDQNGPEVTVHNIQPYLTGLIAAEYGYRLELVPPAAGRAVLRADIRG